MKGLEKNNTCYKCTANCMEQLGLETDQALPINSIVSIHFKAGEYLIRQGSFVSELIFLKSGLVKKVLEANNNRNTILKLIESNSYIGFSLLGNPLVYPFSLVALSDCEICFIRKEAILEVMARNIHFNQILLKDNAADFLFLYKQLSIISTRNSHGKLASAMVYLSNNFTSDVINALSRKELSELASISVESTNKILLQLKNDGIIAIDNGSIIIKRIDLIEKLSTVG